MKICRECNESKPLAEFFLAKVNKDGYENRCKKCKMDLSPEYRSKRREYIREYRRARKDSGHYGKCSNCDVNLGRSDSKPNPSGLCKDCCRGELHPAFSGGYSNYDGYIVYPVGNYGSTLRHRQVMEDMIGRQLYDDETVHHRNGVRDDNRPENLELWVGAPTRGIRSTDAVDWAKEIIRRYDE